MFYLGIQILLFLELEDFWMEWPNQGNSLLASGSWGDYYEKLAFSDGVFIALRLFR